MTTGVGPAAQLSFLAALAFSALAVCGYRYGGFDQAQYLVQVISLQEPGAFADDPYLTSFGALRSVFWWLLAAITTDATRPFVCLGLTLALSVVNGGLLLAIGRSQLASAPAIGRIPLWLLAAAPALCLVVPKELNWFGLVTLGDIELTATFAVLPLVFAAMLAWIRGRPGLCLLASAAAVPIHGQTAAYLLCAWWAASLWTARGRPKALALPIIVGTIGAIALAVERAAVTVDPARLDAFRAVGEAMYAALINPIFGTRSAWAAVAAVTMLGVAAVIARPAGEPVSVCRRRLRVWWCASAVFPAVGLVLLAGGLEEPLLWRLMVGRSLMLPQLAALVVFATWCASAVARGGVTAWIGGGSLFLIAIWPFPHLPRPVAFVTLLSMIALIAASRGFGAGRTSSATPATLQAGRRRLAGVTLGVAGALLVTGAVCFVVRPFPWLSSSQEPEWLEAQEWARENTPPGTRFITPPYLSGWRVGSHRPTFGELKDGALMFYSGEPVLAWVDRMRALGVDSCYRWLEASATRGRVEYRPEDAGVVATRLAYPLALRSNLARIQKIAPSPYVVTEAAHDADVGDVVWTNERFVIRGLGPVEPRLADSE